jgi:hypothetical protein
LLILLLNIWVLSADYLVSPLISFQKKDIRECEKNIVIRRIRLLLQHGNKLKLSSAYTRIGVKLEIPSAVPRM